MIPPVDMNNQQTVFDVEVNTLESLISEMESAVSGDPSAMVNAAYIARRLRAISCRLQDVLEVVGQVDTDHRYHRGEVTALDMAGCIASVRSMARHAVDAIKVKVAVADDNSQLDAARASAIEVAERLRRLGRAEAAESIKAAIAADAGVTKVAV